MDIAVILPCNVYVAPFYRKYEDILIDNNIKFDLIYWNRALIEEKIEGKPIPFNVKDIALSGSKSKIINYIRFSMFAKRKLKQGKYSKVIILGSYSGIMAFLSLYLTKHFKNKYWLDIRDFTFEDYWPYYKAMDIAISNSYGTVISSDKFCQFLPKHDYIMVHNIDEKNIKKARTILQNKTKSDVIRISYIGQVGFYEENQKLLNALKNDQRFKLQYYGARSEFLKKYCEKNKIYNVDFYGRFKPEDTASFYQKTDVINNAYGNNNTMLKTALSNKLYFSTALKLPILVSPNTYMSELTQKYGFGFPVNYDNVSFGNDLYEWYHSFKEFARFDVFWNKAVQDNDLFLKKINEFLSWRF